MNTLKKLQLMIKQLGSFSAIFSFSTLSCPDLRWHELTEITYSLNEDDILADDDIHDMNYFEKTKILKSNPVLLARHFQYRVEGFFKEIVSDRPLDKIKHYVIGVEFKAKSSPHIYSFWVIGVPILSTTSEDEYVAFIDNIIKCDELPNPQERP